MLVSATRTVSTLTLRAGFYGGLFVVVAIVHVAMTTALRGNGWSGGVSLLVSGAVVLAVVLAVVNAADFIVERRAAARELERMRQGLPNGACCVVWRGGDGEAATMAWKPTGPVQIGRAHV